MSHVDALTGFVDVVVEATGRVESVPAHWIGDPVLGRGIHLVPEPGEPADPDFEDAGTPPTEANTHAEIDAYAQAAHMDLPAGATKAEKVELITAALAAGVKPPTPAVDPGVDLVSGTESDGPLIPAARTTKDPGEAGDTTTTSGTDDPASGEENQS